MNKKISCVLNPVIIQKRDFESGVIKTGKEKLRMGVTK
jgi:hypothetical protein